MQKSYPHQNRGNTRGLATRESQAVLQQLEQLNSLDMELYRWGLGWKRWAVVVGL